MKRFRRLSDSDVSNTVTINIEGQDVVVPEGESVAAAVLAQDLDYIRTSPVSGAPRTPLCLMGACFECLMEIDGIRNRQACMVPVAEGMRVRRQQEEDE